MLIWYFVNRTRQSILQVASYTSPRPPRSGMISSFASLPTITRPRKRQTQKLSLYCTQLPQPHLPSFHPVRHLSSHLSQSKLLFPNLTLTALCASHIHRPNSSRLLTRGSLPSFIHDLKSSAHDQQGYILPKRLMNWRVSLCCVRVGRSG